MRLEVSNMKGLKAIITNKITFEKQRGSETIVKQAFLTVKHFIILKKADFDGMLEYATTKQ